MLLDMNTSREEDQDANDLQKELLAYNISTFGADKEQVQEKQVQAQTLPPSHGEDLALLRLLGLGSVPGSDAQDQYIPAIESNLATIEPNLVSFPISAAETQKTVTGNMPPIHGEFTAATTAQLDVLEGGNTTSADLAAGLRTKRRRSSLESYNVQGQPAMNVANAVGQLHQSRQYQESNLENQSLFQSVLGLQRATDCGSLLPQIAAVRGMPKAPPFQQNVTASQCLSLPVGVSQGAKLAAPQEESVEPPPGGLQRITTASILQWQQQQINSDKPAAVSQWEMRQKGWNPPEVGLHCPQGQSFQKVTDQKTKLAQAQGLQLTESELLQQQLDEVKEKVAMLSREKQQRSFLPGISYGEESDNSIMKSGSGQFQDHSLSLPGKMGEANPSIFPSGSDKNGMQAYAWCQGGQTNGGFPSRGNQIGTDTAGAYTTASSLLPCPGGVIQPPFAPGGDYPPRFGNVAADAVVSYTGPACTSSDLQQIMLSAGSLRRQLPSQNLLGTRPCPEKKQSFSDPTLSSSLKVGGAADLSIARSNSVPPPVGSRNDIKRPRSAYNFFYRSERTRLLDELGTKCKVPLEVMTKTIAGRWKSLTSEQRVPFKRLASTDKERYERELRDFNIQERQRLEYLRKESNSP